MLALSKEMSVPKNNNERNTLESPINNEEQNTNYSRFHKNVRREIMKGLRTRSIMK